MTLAALLSLGAATTLGQAGPGDGRALDNNLQQGAGGYNAQQPQPDFQARNNLITGNVTGLGYFHGNVGYGATDEFSGRLSGDSLFRFRAQSLGNTGYAPYSPGRYTPGAGVPPYAGPSVGVYRDFAPTTVTDVRPGTVATVYQAPSSSGLMFRGDSSLNAFSTTASGARTWAGDTLSGAGDQTGRTLELSPLLGVRQLQGANPAAARPTAAPASTAAPAPPGSIVPPLPVPQGLEAPATDPASPEPDGGISPANRVDQPATVKPEVYTQQPRGLSLALGAQIRAMQQPQRVDASQETLDQRIARIEAAMFSPLGSTQAKPGEDVYMDVLARMREQARAARGQAPSTTTTPPQPAGAQAAPGEDLAASPLAPPNEQEQSAAEEARRRAARLAQGLPAEPNGEAGLQGGVGEPGAATPDPGQDPALSDQSVRDLVESLRYHDAALKTLAGQRETRMNQLLRDAETDLAAGKYFDAESKYQQVLTISPGYPLARVGVIHAQLGAGMIRSAGANLRRLFEDHPEMIAVRYDAKLLPSEKRVQWIRQQLDEMIKLSEKRQEPALLLAYLGYQYQQAKLVPYGLDLAEARWPNDPLIPLLRRVWIYQLPVHPAQDATKPPSTPTPDAPAPEAPVAPQTPQAPNPSPAVEPVK